MAKRSYSIPEDMHAKCRNLIPEDPVLQQFIPVHMEYFHLLYSLPMLDCSLYLRAGDALVEYVDFYSFSKEKLDEIAKATKDDYSEVMLLIRKGDMGRFFQALKVVRKERVETLLKRIPSLDTPLLKAYTELANCGPSLVAGAILPDTVLRAQEAVGHLLTIIDDQSINLYPLSALIQADPGLYDHGATTAILSVIFGGKSLSTPLSTDDLKTAALGSLLHDIGKTCPYSPILNHPDADTPAEYESSLDHPRLGFESLTQSISEGLRLDPLVTTIALEHHESLSGSGYPNQKKGRFEEQVETGIHRLSRLVSFSNTFSSLLVARTYKAACGPEEALSIMTNMRSDFDESTFTALDQEIQRHGKVTMKSKDPAPKSSKGKILIIEDGKVSKVS